MFDYSLLLSAIILVSIDFIYLNIIQDYFIWQVKMVQGSAPKINYLGVALCYIFLIIAIHYFIIAPRKSVSDAFLLGLVIYGVYETTNYALLRNWHIFTVFLDTLWGATLFASTTYLVYLLQKYV